MLPILCLFGYSGLPGSGIIRFDGSAASTSWYDPPGIRCESGAHSLDLGEASWLSMSVKAMRSMSMGSVSALSGQKLTSPPGKRVNRKKNRELHSFVAGHAGKVVPLYI